MEQLNEGVQICGKVLAFSGGSGTSPRIPTAAGGNEIPSSKHSEMDRGDRPKNCPNLQMNWIQVCCIECHALECNTCNEFSSRFIFRFHV